ncbi:GDSL-type esterase/lipase family protein [Herbivorax sp. ANBcel31]|uniref:dockerin type I domain-containing protein n=1 Tax=Herbivorax sp. ANBcel31 TaxID=3069754 RepID=UPI0027AFE078|nr:dockerin type I domain-containing protein [Herbivorax sp. ANBcel31]MDQ2087747.1 GDSL-type esterase/lipase family protein [Herbivorax sp. ANBcel31]
MCKFKIQFGKVLILTLLISSIIMQGGIIGSIAQSEPIRIMPIGDSCTAGMGDPQGGGYRTDLYYHYENAGLNVQFVGSQRGGPSTLPERNHEGHSGWTIPQISSNIDGWLNDSNPDVVLLWIGGNDAILSGNINTTGLSNLIDQIINFKSDITIFVADYYPVPESIVDYNVTIPGVVQEKADAGYNVHFVKLSDIDLVHSTDISSDRLHLSPSGYSKIADIWFDSTIDILQSMDDTTPDQPDIKYGDLNGDGVIDSSDYMLLKRHVLTIAPLEDTTAADLNGDGIIDSTDVTLLRRYILEINTVFPVQE